MKKQSISFLPSVPHAGALAIAGGYLILGSAWILFSDQLAARIALTKEMLATISLYKGWGYVLVTAMLLYWLIQRYTTVLSASGAQLQQVIDAMPALIAYVGADRRYQFVNSAYTDWFERDFLGKHVEEVIGARAYRSISKYIDKVLNGETVRYETEVSLPDGERSISATYIPNTGADGRTRGYFSLIHDVTEQKQAREEWRLWADAFEGCAHGIAIDDPNTNRIVVCNPAFAAMHKCRVEDIVGSAILSLYLPVDHEHVRRNVQKADQIGYASFEAAMVRKGEEHAAFPVQVDIVSVLGEDGEIVHRVVTAQDITVRKLVDEKLRESEAKYRTLIEQASDGIFIADPQGKYTEVNSSGCAMLGYTREELLRLSMHDLIDPEDLAARPLRLKELQEGKTLLVERKMRQKSGSTFFAELSAKMLTNGHYQAIVRDITERKHVEKILQESEERYRLVSELTSDYAYKDRVEEDGNIVPEWFTESFTRITGYTLEETRVPGFWQRLVHPEDLPVLSEHMQTVLSGQPDTKEMRIFTKQGEVRWLKDYANPIWSPDHKRIVALYGAVQDVTEHKQAEENLRRFRLLSEHSRDIILFMGYQDGQILDANAAAVQAYGYSRDELLSLTIQDLRASDTLSQTVTQMTEAEANGILFETVHRRRDGSTFPVEVSSQGATIGGVRTLISIIRDITERKNAEKALTESEARFRSLFEQSADAILLLENGVFTDCNPATVEMMRAGSKQQMLSLHPSRLSPPSQPDGHPSAQKADEMIRIALERGSHRFEWTHRRLDGTDFPVEILLTSIATEDRQVIHTVWRDITERKQIELALQEAHDELERKVQDRTAALSEANALLQALMDNMPDHIYFKDTKSRFIRNSRSQANLLGLSDPSEAVGKTDFDFFPHAAKSYAEEQEVMRSGRPLVDFEEWVLWPDGREMWVSTTKMPLRNSEGETIGIFGISRDITERKRSEQAIRQLNADLEKQAEQLQAANKELEAFSYSVSHDLRAPLRAIDGYTRILVEDYESILDDEGKRICGVISREAQRMGQLIDDLLAFSRLGRKEMYASRIDMKALAASVFDELLKEEKRENIDFNLRDLPMAQGDSSLIRQVWVNLLSNAIKFTSKKGRAIIEVGSQESTDEAIYYVRDNGAGFDMEYSNKLFGVFQRLHSESEFNGTGVGLAIVQRIIRRHDGRVWAEGEVEQGATFYFALPHKENLL